MTPSDTKSNRIDRETPNGTHTIHPESNDDEAGAKSRAETALPPLPAAARALSPPSRKREVSSEEERTEARRAANRKSALESRKRRKVLIADLQRAVIDLTKEKDEATKQSFAIRLQLESALAENRQLRFSLMSQQQLAQAASVAAASTDGALPPHAMVVPQQVLVNPAVAMLLSSQASIATTALPQTQQQLPPNPKNINEATNTDVAIFLANQRTATTALSGESFTSFTSPS